MGAMTLGPALQAMNDLYGNQLRLFQNLFLPSVKLARKVRVGSRIRRIYEGPQTPFQRVCDSPASDPERVAKLKRLQQQLDPFELSRTIQAKLEHIFQLSQETAAVEKAASHPPLPQVSTDIHRKKKEAKKKEEKRRRRVTSYVAGRFPAKLHS
jgi:hypothetical protein